MTDSPDTGRELTAQQRTLAEQLRERRPVPAAGFRGALDRHLAAQDPGYGSRPVHLWLITLGYFVACALLLALGALQATGAL